MLLGNRLKAALLLSQGRDNWEKEVNIQLRSMIKVEYTLKTINHLQQIIKMA